MKHFTGIEGLSRHFLFDELITGSAIMRKGAFSHTPPPIHNAAVTLIFEENSTRTRVSMEKAAQRLGCTVTLLVGDDCSLKKRESRLDTCRMLAEYDGGRNVIGIRSPIEGLQSFLAWKLDSEGYHSSIINLGDGRHEHPTQTSLDIVTMAQFGADFGNIGYFVIGGDLKNGRTIPSLVLALARLPNVIPVFVSAPTTALAERYKRLFPRYIETSAMSDLFQYNDLVQWIYWTRPQLERDDASAFLNAKQYRITSAVLDALPEAYVMHPLPINQDIQEIDASIRKHPRVIVDIQARNGIPTRMFLIDLLLKHEGSTGLLEEQAAEIIEKVPPTPVQQYLSQKSNKDIAIFSQIDDGTVIDHLPTQAGQIVLQILQKAKELNGGVKLLAHDAPSKHHGKKDTLVLQGHHLTTATILVLASRFPEATFNIIERGMFRKLVVRNPSPLVTTFSRCPNPACVSNQEPECPVHFLAGPEKIHSCRWCRHEFPTEQLN